MRISKSGQKFGLCRSRDQNKMEFVSQPSSEDICRVCRLPGTSDRPLFHPCLCTGSIRYVHQDCLMQWLRHSRKEYCELCHYKFQFASVYRADMPKWLPINYVYRTLVHGLNHKLQRWVHLGFVFFVWLYLLPVCTYRVYSLIFKGDFWPVVRLLWDIITFANLITECIIGIFIVFISIVTLICLVWLKDQLTTGHGPEWLTADQQEAQRQATPTANNIDNEERTNINDPKKKLLNEAHCKLRERHRQQDCVNLSNDCARLRKDIEDVTKELEEMSLDHLNRKTVDLRTRALEIQYKLCLPMTHCMPTLRAARLKNIEGVEKWTENILNDLRRKKIIPQGIGGLPPPADKVVDETPLPSLRARGLTAEQATLYALHEDRPVPLTDEREIESLQLELQDINSQLSAIAKEHMISQQNIMSGLLRGDIDPEQITEFGIFEKEIIKQYLEYKDLYYTNYNKEVSIMTSHGRKVREEYPILGEDNRPPWYKRIWITTTTNNANNDRRNNEGRGQRPRAPPPVPPPRPNIGRALVGLAREPQDANDEALQADQLTKMLGLDGSFQFLEHVMWMLLFMTAILFVFGYVPSKVGQVFASRLTLWDWAWNDNWRILFSTLTGYGLVLLFIVALYYGAGVFKLARIKSLLGIAYLALKVSILLIMEAGVFPLFCGWWLDICSFSLIGTSLKNRQASLNYAPGTVMFLHWLAGMIFVFYFASFVVLLREVLRPGVLWFLRNLNDQNFHPIQDMISQPFQKHLRRFLMSNIMFGVSILVLVFIPSKLLSLLLPEFLPYNLTLMSTVSPIREIQLELLLLQFVIPTLLEHSNTRAAIKNGVKYWSQLVASLLGLDSYLLDKPQTGGVVVNMHGAVIREVPYDPNWDTPVHEGPNEVMGPGFAPFKPYLRTANFPLRVLGLIITATSTVLCVSVFFLLTPVLMGRVLMSYIGLINSPDIYTGAIGLYILWLAGKVCTAIGSKVPDGAMVVINHLLLWLYQSIKCFIAGFLLFFVIPLLLGNLVDLLIISPIRVPVNKTPIIYLSTEWALGLLHMKCACGVIWLTDTSFKRTLDQLYQRGVKNMSLSFVLTQVAWPVISYLILFISLPYVLCTTLLYKTGLTSYSTSFIWYRYGYALFFILLILMSALLLIMKQSSKIYTGIRNREYLIGRQLVNYGTVGSASVTPLSVPVQETGHD